MPLTDFNDILFIDVHKIKCHKYRIKAQTFLLYLMYMFVTTLIFGYANIQFSGIPLKLPLLGSSSFHFYSFLNRGLK